MLALQDCSFGYTPEKLVLKEISFTAKKGELIALIGQSGCGKSSLLKTIYGLYDLQKGSIHWAEKQILGPSFNLVPGEAYIKYLSQDFELMPFISAAENIGKHLSNFYPKQKQLRIQELLEMVEMQDFAHVKTKNLSGGQQQRIALAQVLAKEPELLLLDEPFSHMDNFRKNSLRRNLFAYLKRKKITCIIATHDSTDALSFSDTTIVLKNGRIFSKAAPASLYFYPPNKYVASLFGEVNELAVSLFRSNYQHQKILIYPHELFTVSESLFVAKVVAYYFKGNVFLIKAIYQERYVVFFENEFPIDKNTEVFLDTYQDVLEKRLPNR